MQNYVKKKMRWCKGEYDYESGGREETKNDAEITWFCKE
jgi:hypothetical protein